MLDSSHPIMQILKEDKRYKFEAYVFVFEALHYAQNVLEMGSERPTEPVEGEEEPAGRERHVTGQELCEGIRLYALEQYGYMAKTVLNGWGVRATADFGEIVFNLIRIGQMRKTPNDSLDDFKNIYDFDVAFKKQFKIEKQPTP